jgi:hypothetical protein
MYVPSERDEHYGGNIARYLLDLNDEVSAGDGGQRFRSEMDAAARKKRDPLRRKSQLRAAPDEIELLLRRIVSLLISFDAAD